ncbi:uncharacterized protein LOC130284639 [Hyla sarda]|uniref:uncharacterized protein LOC130284639 n=1 Tax=Hyla sarda TaxID=327740 RepID=UPI0024C2A255|nr:uncharacterized protein LOC130284639 [Hyla sarda]XP_056391154.1 uncharacterized protein LOC130284639 [Hyla sarda]XP_056391155.1 uncharacterized protein LOC130284639 [Hyla sarda]XP_056391156.1 uncharacterized protein LOC130284639 [Hyla sarda]XP_056391157.1 uncharacterized protein LOC130284639 [Hyla sarda]XP_056391159.1 uncharacterized protein LOC130284639 [Hyla sarda]XP_056391160.1 uncharacterized protein LOC130284639 [Hyla sarda]XP_056391161.1 uncharacterized protein LOC130284639 [Hyla sa
MPQPSTQQWINITDKSWEVANFPNCVGAVDGKHIRIQKPSNTGSEFFNYKKYFSIILIAIANAQYKFVAVDIDSYGRSNDSRVFKSSAMGKRLYSGDFGLPAPRPFPGTEGPPMPFVVVGDEAFQMCANLLKPYSNRGRNFRQRIYNYRLTCQTFCGMLLWHFGFTVEDLLTAHPSLHACDLRRSKSCSHSSQLCVDKGASAHGPSGHRVLSSWNSGFLKEINCSNNAHERPILRNSSCPSKACWSGRSA